MLAVVGLKSFFAISFFFFILIFYLFFYLFIFGCVGSSFLCEGFLQLRRAGATLHRGVRASLVAEHRLQTRRLSNCGSRAQSLRGMWDLPRPGREPVSPALTGRFSTTAPPGKPSLFLFTASFGLCRGKKPLSMNNLSSHYENRNSWNNSSLVFADVLLKR